MATRRKRRKKRLTLKSILFIVIAAIILFGAYFIYDKFFRAEETYEIPDGTAEFHYIDVGQGDSTLIMTGGKNILIDTGERDAENKIKSYLKDHKVETIDYFIITHFDSDHFGNATYILNNYKVENLIMPNQEKTTKMYETFISALEDKSDINVIIANDIAGEKIKVADLELSFLAPLKNNYTNSNDYSVCFVARFGKNKFLFTGDAEEKALADIDGKYSSKDLDCDVFQAGHHGSSNANTKELMDKATPSIIVISCGKDNKYGHPHTEAMNLFKGTGATIYRTDESGDIVLKTDGENITTKDDKLTSVFAITNTFLNDGSYHKYIDDSDRFQYKNGNGELTDLNLEDFNIDIDSLIGADAIKVTHTGKGQKLDVFPGKISIDGNIESVEVIQAKVYEVVVHKNGDEISFEHTNPTENTEISFRFTDYCITKADGEISKKPFTSLEDGQTLYYAYNSALDNPTYYTYLYDYNPR